MNHHYYRRSGAAALLFVFCLVFSPVATAAPQRRDQDFTEKIVRIIRSVRNVFGGVSSQENLPAPPKP